MRGPKRAGGERSNAWSESKYTNQTRFDPLDSEIPSWRFRGRPALGVKVEGREDLPIFVRNLHAAFLRPFGPSDVAEVIQAVPAAFLFALEGVFLLGGSLKQIRVAKTQLFHYGCYGLRRIYLHAFPRSLLHQRLTRRPKPSVLHGYMRAGATCIQQGGTYRLSFTETSLRRFFLHDVLLHELGHHVDRRGRRHGQRESESYARWFAEAQARNLACSGRSTNFSEAVRQNA